MDFAFVARLDPIGIVPLQLVAEPEFFGGQEGRGGIAKFDFTTCGRQFEDLVENNGLAIAQHLLEFCDRTNRINRQRRRFDQYDSVDRGEPETTIGGAAAGRLCPPIALRREHAVVAIIRRRADRSSRAAIASVKLRLTDPKDPFHAAHPEVAPVVVQNLANRIARQAFARCIRRHTFLTQPVETAPQVPIQSDPPASARRAKMEFSERPLATE